MVGHADVLRFAAGVGGVEGVEGDAKVGVGVGDFDEEVARRDLQGQLLGDLPPQRLRPRLARLDLAAGELP